MCISCVTSLWIPALIFAKSETPIVLMWQSGGPGVVEAPLAQTQTPHPAPRLTAALLDSSEHASCHMLRWEWQRKKRGEARSVS